MTTIVDPDGREAWRIEGAPQRVREALAIAIDRTKLTEGDLEGMMHPAEGFDPLGERKHEPLALTRMPIENRDHPVIGKDPRFRALLKRMGLEGEGSDYQKLEGVDTMREGVIEGVTATTADKERMLRMLTGTLEHMAMGGIRDHVGGGFHRYSVDERWFVPHFEKMLYDNGQLALAYLHGYLLTGDPSFRQTCEETLDFLRRRGVDEQRFDRRFLGG